jgi:hypothetical protein
MDASGASGGKGRLEWLKPALISSFDSLNRPSRIYYAGPLQEVPYG